MYKMYCDVCDNEICSKVGHRGNGHFIYFNEKESKRLKEFSLCLGCAKRALKALKNEEIL